MEGSVKIKLTIERAHRLLHRAREKEERRGDRDAIFWIAADLCAKFFYEAIGGGGIVMVDGESVARVGVENCFLFG